MVTVPCSWSPRMESVCLLTSPTNYKPLEGMGLVLIATESSSMLLREGMVKWLPFYPQCRAGTRSSLRIEDMNEH